MFLQETHSIVFDEKRQDDLKGKLLFLHGHSNSCGIAIGFLGNMNFNALNKIKNNDGRILILDVQVDDAAFLLINLYNANKEYEQLNVLTTLCNVLSNITDLHCKNIIFGGNFNVFFDTNYEAQGGNPTLKKTSVAKLIHIKESLELCDVCQVKNLKKKRFTFRRRHNSGFIQRRLDYFLVSNILQESIKKTDILTSVSTDHSTIFFPFSKKLEIPRGNGFWKFINSLCSNTDYTTKLKNHLKLIQKTILKENITDEQMIWEYIKYEIRKFSIKFSTQYAKDKRTKIFILEKN